MRNSISVDDDEEFIDFLLKCLEIDPSKRWSPEEALKHPWLKRNGIKSMLKDNEEVVQSVLGNDTLANLRARSKSKNRYSAKKPSEKD